MEVVGVGEWHLPQPLRQAATFHGRLPDPATPITTTIGAVPRVYLVEYISHRWVIDLPLPPICRMHRF